MDLDRQKDTVASFRRWFEGGSGWQQANGTSLKRTMEDNRRRYRMIMKDAADREELGLSALPSTKSTSIVDNAVVDAIQEYYQTDAITFTASDDSAPNIDEIAKWSSELFHLRARHNGFWVWHLQSLKAGLVDGLEAGMVRWRKESYEYPDNHYYFLPSGEEISEQEYKAARKTYPITVDGPFDPAKGRPARIKIPFNEHYRAERTKKTRTVADTWECVQLKPGENLLWDFKNPILDLNRCQWVIVIVQMQKEDILAAVKQGLFDKISDDELSAYLQANATSANQISYTDTTSLATDPDTVDMGEFNTAEVWLAFERKDCQWQVTFSLQGERLLAKAQSVNDVFFGGRPFDRLPVVMGASDIELWEALGRGIPKLIAPIEDELTDHRNNVNDIAKQAASGKYRVNDDSDVDLNSLLNDKVFFAKPGEVEKLDFAQEMAVVVRAADLTGGDIASLAPVSMADSQLVGRGNAKDTLGSVQLALGGNDKKLNARLLIRNITFLQPMLRIVAEMMMAFETDQTKGRIAGNKAKLDMSPNGPLMSVVDGKSVIDFSLLDFDADIQINAGLGTVPKQQKAGKLMQYTEWGKAHGVPLDIEEIDKQLKVLNGFNEDQFVLPPEKRQGPPPEPVKYQANITVDLTTLLQLSPESGKFLLDKMLAGEMAVTANVKEQATKTPGYLKDEPTGSPSQPVMAQHRTMEQPQGQMGEA